MANTLRILTGLGVVGAALYFLFKNSDATQTGNVPTHIVDDLAVRVARDAGFKGQAEKFVSTPINQLGITPSKFRDILGSATRETRQELAREGKMIDVFGLPTGAGKGVQLEVVKPQLQFNESQTKSFQDLQNRFGSAATKQRDTYRIGLKPIGIQATGQFKAGELSARPANYSRAPSKQSYKSVRKGKAR